MKTFLALSALCFAAPAFAGTAASYKNDALGFTMTMAAMSDDVSICNEKDQCLDFKAAKYDGAKKQYKLCDSANNCKTYREKGVSDNVSYYKEVNGKCLLEVEAKNLDLGGFMFDLGLQIVRVTRGVDDCKLDTDVSGKRPLFGTYQ
jgi:hypothetical protein